MADAGPAGAAHPAPEAPSATGADPGALKLEAIGDRSHLPHTLAPAGVLPRSPPLAPVAADTLAQARGEMGGGLF